MRIIEVQENQYYNTQTELIIFAGFELQGKEFIYDALAIYNNDEKLLVLKKYYYCGNNWKYYLIETDDGKLYAVKSNEEPIIKPRGEAFLSFLKSLDNVKEVWTAHGLVYSKECLVYPKLWKKFEQIAIKELGEVPYYYSSYIPLEKFIKVLEETLA
jgi:hypothetical protein